MKAGRKDDGPVLADAVLCERAQREGRGGEAESALVERHMRMCLSEARDFTPRGLEVGDFESEALLALQRAIYVFDPGRKVSFRHFAKQIVRNAMLDELRRDRRVTSRSAAFGLDDLLPSGQGFVIELFEDPNSNAHEETIPLRDAISRFSESLVRAYRAAVSGQRAAEPLRRALASSAVALIRSGAVEEPSEMEAFVIALGDTGGQLLLGACDDEGADRAAIRLAQAHLGAAIASAEGDESFRQAAIGMDPDAALAAIRFVAGEVPLDEAA